MNVHGNAKSTPTGRGLVVRRETADRAGQQTGRRVRISSPVTGPDGTAEFEDSDRW